MSTHNICFCREIRKIFIWISSTLELWALMEQHHKKSSLSYTICYKRKSLCDCACRQATMPLTLEFCRIHEGISLRLHGWAVRSWPLLIAEGRSVLVVHSQCQTLCICKSTYCIYAKYRIRPNYRTVCLVFFFKITEENCGKYVSTYIKGSHTQKKKKKSAKHLSNDAYVFWICFSDFFLYRHMLWILIWIALTWIYIVCQGRVYPSSAGQGLRQKRWLWTSINCERWYYWEFSVLMALI